MQLPPEKKKVQKFQFQSRASSGWKPKVVEGVERLMECTFGGDLKEFTKAYNEESAYKPEIINVQDDKNGNVPLHIASSKGNIELIAFMIRKRASVDVQDFYGNTPLLYAIDKRHNAAAQMLIKNGANIKTADFRGNTPLHLAAARDNLEMVHYLLGRGAEPEELNHANEKPAQKTSFPPIADIINRAAERKKNGVDDSKMVVNWMGFGIGMGVGLGIALAKQQQIYHEQNMMYEERRRKEEEEKRQKVIDEAKADLAKRKAAAAKKFLGK